MSLPDSRNTTYVPKSVDTAGSQVKSADLNDLQDQIAAMKTGEYQAPHPDEGDPFPQLSAAIVKTVEPDIRHGERTIPIPMHWIRGLVGTPVGDDYGDLNGVWTGDIGTAVAGGKHYEAGNAAGGAFAFDLPLSPGDRIKAISVRAVENTGSAACAMNVYKRSIAVGAAPGAPSLLLATQTTADVATNIQDIGATGLSEVVVADTLYTVFINITGAAVKLYGAFLTYDRP